MRSRRLVLPAAIAAITLLGACGNIPESERASTSVSTPVDPSAAPTSTVVKPEVKLPATAPTKLTVTQITPGSGAPAKDGDIVVVDYVGVVSSSGEMFDNSYDRGKPDVVSPLGKAQVIDGWNQGLVGATTGERLQLDIPSDLAYGPTGQGVIKPGEAISFVIDVRQVIDPGTPDQAPSIQVQPAAPRSDLKIEDLVQGTGATVEAGKSVVVHLVGYRADTGAQILSTWTQSQPLTFAYGTDQVLPGIVNGIKDMKVGGRRRLDIPFAEAFGAQGNTQIGVPASTDVVLLVDLLAVY